MAYYYYDDLLTIVSYIELIPITFSFILINCWHLSHLLHHGLGDFSVFLTHLVFIFIVLFNSILSFLEHEFEADDCEDGSTPAEGKENPCPVHRAYIA